MSEMKFSLRLSSLILGIECLQGLARSILSIYDGDWIWVAAYLLGSLGVAMMAKHTWNASRYGVVLDLLIEARDVFKSRGKTA